MLLESDILRLFFTGPYLVSSPLCSVSGVDCPSVLPRQLLLFASLLSSRNSSFCAPATNSLSPVQLPTASPGSRRQLSFASPYHFWVRRDFRSKNPLSGFAPKQTRLLWRPTPIVLHYLTHSWEDKGVHTFPKGIYPKVNVIARLEYELAYYDSAVHRFNHHTTRTLPQNVRVAVK